MKSLQESDLGKVIEEYEEAFFDIPFGNSRFQIENFIINAAQTPERAYRSIGLTMRAKIQALREAFYGFKKDDVDIAELEHKAKTAESIFDKQRHQIDIERKIGQREDARKLINDALSELSFLYSVFKKMPRYTRQEFEAGERNHFRIQLEKQAMGIQGALESLDNMDEDIGRFLRTQLPKCKKVMAQIEE